MYKSPHIESYILKEKMKRETCGVHLKIKQIYDQYDMTYSCSQGISCVSHFSGL